LVKERRIDKKSLWMLLKGNLHQKPYRKLFRQGLSDKQCEKKVKSSKMLSKRHGAEGVKKSIFSDEKLFVTEAILTAQNDRVHACNRLRYS
jgi:hypothetical protein